MPRKPTGRPPGRPVGSGAVLERDQVRLTVRIPQTLFDRLEAYAEGRHFTRGTPQLAGAVRDALEHFLTCPYSWQTETVPVSLEPLSQPTETVLALAENIMERIIKVAAPSEVDTLEDMPLYPDVNTDKAVAEAARPLDPEPLERDSVDWRRWFALSEVQRASGPLTSAQILKELEGIADDELAVSKALIRADLEFWCKAGLMTRDGDGGYSAQAAAVGKKARPRKRQAAPVSTAS